MIGLSLGESAGLFGVRAWRGRDEMFRRMQVSPLFNSDLAPPYDTARTHWNLPASQPVDWAIGVIAASVDDVTAALRPGLKAYLLIINTPTECVIGGQREDVRKLAAAINRPFFPLEGVTLAHCEAGKPAEVPYRDLHTLPVTALKGVTVYSGAWGKSYPVTESSAADSITAGLLNAIDVPAVVRAAYRDGVRVFLEVGPGGSCTRMIDVILAERPHLARAAHAGRQDAISQILRVIANLAAERLPIDLAALYGRETRCPDHQEQAAAGGPVVVVPVGNRPPVSPEPQPKNSPQPPPPPAQSVIPEEPVVVSGVPILAPMPSLANTREGEAPAELDHPHTREGEAPAEREGVTARPEPRPPVISIIPPGMRQPDSTQIREGEAPAERAGGPARREPRPPVIPIIPPGITQPDRTHTLPVADHGAIPSLRPAIVAACDVQVAVMQAHETFLRVNQRLMDSAAGIIRFQTGLLEQWIQNGEQPSLPLWTVSAPETELAGNEADSVPRTLTYEQCCTFAAGRVADVLGPLFAEVDSFPTRVRLPDGPLQLVDRITRIDGEPKSMTHGRVVTEHTVRPNRWYLEAGRIPTAIAVEAGQADLFLSGFLGIDFQTRGLAVYRLLDAVVSFHRGLPVLGETAVYDIHIDEFVKQGDAWIFRFRFDGTVGGEPFITMRNGVAGFFTAAALAAGKGIVQTALDRQQLPGKKPENWRELVPFPPCSLTAAEVDALREGDLLAAFGGAFASVTLPDPVKLPGGMLRLVDRVPIIDPTGGRFGIGFVRAEFDIHPDDWFLICHFVDDRVMPGTLMYECCLHTLRIFLMRMGWVAEALEFVCEPVPGVNSRLKCRGQVLDSTKTVTYEVTVKELGYRPEPYCLADALMYADGKPIVEITNMSLQMTGLSEPRLRQIWSGQTKPSEGLLAKTDQNPAQPDSTPTFRVPRSALRAHAEKPALYDSASILAFSNGKPSEAFGEPYRVFDADRVIARLPGPPFQFIDRITAVSGEPFALRSGASCEGQYDIPPDAWYFEANRSEQMPFSILLEIALQPCGWLAAYCGSALTSPDDLSFRNLGGKATQFLPVTAQTGTLTMTATMTNVSQSAGMIIQHYDMRITSRAGTVYEGTTYFGFFAKAQLANQVGIREAKVPWPTDSDVARAIRGELPHDPPFPAPMMRMVDQIETFLPDGGSKGLGLVVGRIAVDPEFWFFKAHFFQDPVWPGSLGLESFLQLLKYVAWQRWGAAPVGGWQTLALNRPHSWSYRGQVIPTDKAVTVLLEVTFLDDDTRRLRANGFLTVDGRVIYQMTDFTLE
jgi:3-hydroxymyristoyl/3-hydroxydecanoyl-(acyl carrier protein) dehydratase